MRREGGVKGRTKLWAFGEKKKLSNHLLYILLIIDDSFLPRNENVFFPLSIATAATSAM